MSNDDLYAAANAARFLVRVVRDIHALIEEGWDKGPVKVRYLKVAGQNDSGVDQLVWTEAVACDENPVKRLFAELNQKFSAARDAIHRVTTELRRTRTCVFRSGDLVAVTAHEAAIKLVYLLNQQWSRQHYGIEIEQIGRKVQVWPDADEVIAEIELEITKARERRNEANLLKPEGKNALATDRLHNTPPANEGGTPSADPKQTGAEKSESMDKLSLALATLSRHPDWSAAKIANTVGCTGAYLSRQPKWRAAVKAIKGLGQEGKPRSRRHHGRDMDQYADSRAGQPVAAPVVRCASKGCGDPAETDADGRLLMHEGKPYCRECRVELSGG